MYKKGTSHNLQLEAEDYKFGEESVERSREDERNHSIPDGLYLFMSTDVPKAYWEETNKVLTELKGKYILYGISRERIKSAEAGLLERAVKDGEIKDKSFLSEIFPWGDTDMDMKPIWFEDLKIKAVPAFVIKDGNTVCLLKGSLSVRGAARKLYELECPVFETWMAKNNISWDMIR